MEAADRQDASAGKSATSSSVFSRNGTWLCCAFIVVLLALVFEKTIFSGGSISRLCVLAEWDSVFDQWRTGRVQPYDPSLVQIFLPDYVFLAKNACRGILPMWNPNCGLGYPFIGDIQSSVFAPLRGVFNFMPNLRTYNYYMILELVVCAISTFFLSMNLLRKNSDNRTLLLIASVFASICYTFCPYNMWYLELNLGSSASLFPLTALAFVNAAEKKSYLSAIIAGVAAGLLIISGHPECSFFGILLSSALMYLLLVLEKGSSFLLKTWQSVKILTVAALATVASSAPALFPFAEYLLNGQSYKYGSTYSTPVSWNGILFNLANPGQNGASPYLGVIASLFIPAALIAMSNGWRSRYRLAAVAILTVLTFVLVAQLGPVQNIFIKPPFTAIITRYALPYLLMLFSVMAAAGLYAISNLLASLPSMNELRELNSDSLPPWTKFFLYGASIIATATLIFAGSQLLGKDANFMHVCDFDAMLPGTAFNASAWRRDLICSVLLFFSFILGGLISRIKAPRASRSSRHRENKKPLVNAPMLASAGLPLALMATVLSLVCILSVAKQSLPQQNKFFYPETELLQKLKNDKFRTISTCEYVLRPATNCVYGINFLSVHNPLFPKRFFEFIKACGAETDMFNQKFSNDRISPLLNLASVKYILSIDSLTDKNRFSLSYKAKNNIYVFENKEAAPRAYLVHSAIHSSDADDSLKKIQLDNFNPSTTVVIEANALSTDPNYPKGAPLAARPSTESYEQVETFDSTNPNQISITCNSKSPAWLVLTDIYYPGWNVYVDGQRASLKHANYAFRAVHLEEGQHAIRFAYEPLSLLIGFCTVALFTFLLACLTIGGLLKRQI